jgi:hypothetical protein
VKGEVIISAAVLDDAALVPGVTVVLPHSGTPGSVD